MNFCRPSFFALEAEPELSRVIKALDLLVLYSDDDSTGAIEYDRTRFLEGWRVGNELGYTIMSDRANHGDVTSLPEAALQRIWRWNLARNTVQDQLGGSVFVPKIVFCKDSGAVRTAVIWGDGIPIVFPTFLDAVVVILKSLAPWTLFGRKTVIALADWKLVRPIAERHGQAQNDAVIPNYLTPPREVVSFLRTLEPRPKPLEYLRADTVLDAELVARYLR